MYEQMSKYINCGGGQIFTVRERRYRDGTEKNGGKETTVIVIGLHLEILL